VSRSFELTTKHTSTTVLSASQSHNWLAESSFQICHLAHFKSSGPLLSFFPLSIPHLQATNISLYGASTVAYLQVSIPHTICCTAVNGSHPQARSPHPRRFSTCLPDRSRLLCLVKASRSRHLSIAAGGSLLHMLLAAGLSIAAQLRMPYRAAGQSHVTIHGTSNLEIDEPFTSMVK
jgi:hypothetical protein